MNAGIYRGLLSKLFLTLMALVVFTTTGCSGGKPSGSTEPRSEPATDGQVVQGQPMESSPTSFEPAKRELSAQADLEALSQSAPPPKVKDGYQALTLDRLSSFEYPLNLDGTVGELDDGSKPTIPKEIRALDQKKVSISGYAMPLDFRQTEVTFFILNRNQLQCCYGQEPQINEYCVVMMKGPTKIHLDKPVTVSGVISVGEYSEGGMLICLYRLSGVSVEIMEE